MRGSRVRNARMRCRRMAVKRARLGLERGQLRSKCVDIFRLTFLRHGCRELTMSVERNDGLARRTCKGIVYEQLSVVVAGRITQWPECGIADPTVACSNHASTFTSCLDSSCFCAVLLRPHEILFIGYCRIRCICTYFTAYSSEVFVL